MAQQDIDEFLKYANERAEIHRKNIDIELYNFLLDSAEKLSILTDSQREEMLQIIEKVNKNVTEIRDLDKITEIYFYEGQYATTSREVQQTILYLTTIYAKNFEDNNLDKIEEVIINDKDFKGNLALEFYLKIGLIKSKTNRILNYINNNYNSLTENQQKLSLQAFSEYDPHDAIEEILVKSGLFTYKEKRDKVWWKFW